MPRAARSSADGFGPAAPGPPSCGSVGGLRLGVEHRGQVDAGHAVDEGVVVSGDLRPAGRRALAAPAWATPAAPLVGARLRQLSGFGQQEGQRVLRAGLGVHERAGRHAPIARAHRLPHLRRIERGVAGRRQVHPLKLAEAQALLGLRLAEDDVRQPQHRIRCTQGGVGRGAVRRPLQTMRTHARLEHRAGGGQSRCTIRVPQHRVRRPGCTKPSSSGSSWSWGRPHAQREACKSNGQSKGQSTAGNRAAARLSVSLFDIGGQSARSFARGGSGQRADVGSSASISGVGRFPRPGCRRGSRERDRLRFARAGDAGRALRRAAASARS